MSNTQIHVHVWKLGVRRDHTYLLFALLFCEHLDHFPIYSARNNREEVSSWEKNVSDLGAMKDTSALWPSPLDRKIFPHAFRN